MQRTLADAMARAPTSSLRSDRTYDALMAHNKALAASADAVVALRDRLAPSHPQLAVKTNDFAQATSYLAYLTASLAGAKHREVQDLSTYEDGLTLATRQRELALRAALAQCNDDGSRDQSDAWKKDSVAKLAALKEPVLRCITTAAPDRSMTLRLKIHVDDTGQVDLAGPDAPFGPEDEFTTNFMACAVRAAEGLTFLRPQGRAIVLVPIEHEPIP